MKIPLETPPKKYACHVCPKIFKAKKSLQDHQLSHSGHRPFKCEFKGCGKSFIQFSSLQKHKRVHNGERPYNCSLCFKTFSQISNLNRHKRIHSKEKLFKCDQCLASFTTSSNLKQHSLTHKNKELRRMFLCPHCLKTFISAQNLKKHLKSKHPDKDYNIEISEKQSGANNSDGDCIIKHKDHIDLLKNGFLYEIEQATHKISLKGHKLEDSEEALTHCQPLDEFSHIKSYQELGLIYKAVSLKTSDKINYEMLMAEENCTSFACRCPSCDICKMRLECEKNSGKIPAMKNCAHKFNVNPGGKIDENKNLKENTKDSKTNCCKTEETPANQEKPQVKQEKNNEAICFCRLTKEFHHVHGPNCGHSFVFHNDHMDFIVDGRLHFPHNGHCDDHGLIEFYNEV